MIPAFLRLVGKPGDLVVSPPVSPGQFFSRYIFPVINDQSTPVVVFHQVWHSFRGPSIWILSTFAVALAHQYQLFSRHFQKRHTGKWHCMIIKQQFSTDIYPMGMCIQQYLVTSSMNFRILADHTEQFCCFCHSFIVRGIQVYLPHMECLIATVDVSGCPVIKPQSCFLPGQIRNPPVFCRILSPAGKSAGFVCKQRIIQAKTPVFRFHTKCFKHIVRDLYCLHTACDPLKDAGLQDHFRILGMHFICQFL